MGDISFLVGKFPYGEKHANEMCIISKNGGHIYDSTDSECNFEV